MEAWKIPFEEAVQCCAKGPLGQEAAYQESYNYLQEFWSGDVDDMMLIQYMSETPSLHTVAQLNDVIMRRHMEHPHKYDVQDLQRVYIALFRQIFDIENAYAFSTRAIMIRSVMRVIHCHAFELLFLFEELGMAYHTLVEYSHVHHLHPIFFKCVEELFVEFTTAVPRYGKFAIDFRNRCDSEFMRLLIPNLMVHVLDALDHVDFDSYPNDVNSEATLTSFLIATKLAMFWNEDDDLHFLMCPFTIRSEYISFIGRLRDKMFYLFERYIHKEEITMDILTIIARIANAMGRLVDDTEGLYYLELHQNMPLLTHPDTLNLYREGVLSVMMVLATRAGYASKNYPVVAPVVNSILSIMEADAINLIPFIISAAMTPLDFLCNYERTMHILSHDCLIPGTQDRCYRISRTILQQLTLCDIEDAREFEAAVRVATIAGLKKLPDFTDDVSNLFNGTLLEQNEIADLEYFRRMRTVLAVIANIGSRILDKLPSPHDIVARYFRENPERFCLENNQYLLCYDGAVKQYLLPETNELDPVGRFTTYAMYLFEKVFAVVPNAAPYPPLIQSMVYHVTEALSNYLKIIRYSVDEEPIAIGEEPSVPFLVPNDADFTSFATNVFNGLLTVLVSPQSNEDVHPSAAKCMRTMAENGYYVHIVGAVKEAMTELPQVKMPPKFFSIIAYIYYYAADRSGIELYSEMFWLAQHVGSNGAERSLDQMDLEQLGTMIEFYTGIADIYLLFTPVGISGPLMEFHDAVIRFLPEHVMNPDFADKVVNMIDQFSRVWDRLEQQYFVPYLATFFESLRLVMTAYEPFWAERDASTSDVGSYDILERLLRCLKNVLLRASEDEIEAVGEMGVYVALHHLTPTRVAIKELQTPFIEYLEYIVATSCGLDVLSRIALNTDWFRPFIHDCITNRYGDDMTESALNMFPKVKIDERAELEHPEWIAYLRRMLPLFFYTAVTNVADEDIYVAACAVVYRFFTYNPAYFNEFFNQLVNAQPIDVYKEDIMDAFNRITDVRSGGDFRDKFSTFYKNVSRKLILPPGMNDYCG
uniref:Non-specific serine/threonine protein kinase n=1 Tax=Panagrellus redivivus TaxID=6233 RepID=A0A7E4W247_PANRE